MMLVTDIDKLHEVSAEAVGSVKIKEVVAALLVMLEKPDDIGRRALGVSAPQLGYQVRIFVMKYGYGSISLVNPVIIKRRGEEVREEECLSLPGKRVRVPRPKIITVQGSNQYQKFVKYKLAGIDARVACHEIDHLDGKLIIDYE